MATRSSGSVWFGRLVLGVATLLFVRIGVGHILDPVGSVAAQQITLGSAAAVTVMRVSGSVFLGIALVLLPSVVSERRLLAGLGTLLTIATTVTAVRLLGLSIDGSAPFTLRVLKPELALVALSTIAFLWERRRHTGVATHVRTATRLSSIALLGMLAMASSACSSDSAAANPAPTPLGADAGAAQSWDPLPMLAQGPAIPSTGYLVQEVSQKLYWLTDGIYSCMFLSTGSGVIVVDAPQTIAPNLLAAIASVTSEPVTHVVYSHHHADHIGGAGVLPKDATYIAQADTASLLAREADPNRPLPTLTFSDTYTLTVGAQTLLLDYHGPNHDLGNIFIYAPAQKVLMLVDVVWPGWAPFDELGSPVDVKGYLAAHDQALSYDFDTLIAGHVNRLGTKADVITDQQYLADLLTNAGAALQHFDLSSLTRKLSDPSNVWAYGAALLDAWPTACVAAQLGQWRGRLGAVDVFARQNCSAMQSALRAGDLP